MSSRGRHSSSVADYAKVAGYAAIGTISARAAGGLLDPFIEDPAQLAREQSPVFLPDPSSLLAAYRFGILNWDDFRKAANYQGIFVGKSADPKWDFHGRIWRAMQTLLTNHIGPEMVCALSLRGQIDNDEREWLLKRLGMPWKWWSRVAEMMRDRPNPELLIQLLHYGHITLDEFNSLWEWTGANYTDWEKYQRSLDWTPTIPDLLVALNRRYVDFGNAYSYLQRLGVTQEVADSVILPMRRYIPPVQDLVRFQVREAFRDDLAARLQLDTDWDKATNYRQWADAQGLGDVTIKDANGNPVTIDFAKLYWRAHWVLPSPTQLYEMVRRLRPTGGPGNGPRDPSGEVVTLADVLETLKYNDYAPLWTGKLTAISYRPITRVDLRRLHYRKIIDKAELIEGYKDIGYIERDARRLADWTERENNERQKREDDKKLRRVRTKVTNWCLAAYKTGMIERGIANGCLQGNGMDPLEAAQWLDTTDFEVELELVRKTIVRIRTEYKEGAITIDQARVALINLGLTGPRINQYLTYWGIDRSVDTRVMQTSKVLDLAEREIMPPAEAVNRLRNLGWTEPDTLFHMAQVEQDIAIKAARAAEKAAKTEAAKAKAKAAEIKAMEAKLRQARRDLAAHSSPAMMRRWLAKNLIEVGDTIDRLKFYGWPDDDIERWLDETGHGQED